MVKRNDEDRAREERIKKLLADEERIRRINEEQERRLRWVWLHIYESRRLQFHVPIADGVDYCNFLVNVGCAKNWIFSQYWLQYAKIIELACRFYIVIKKFDSRQNGPPNFRCTPRRTGIFAQHCKSKILH